jgi:predicted RNA-binding Zn ribbon-like protein
MDGDGPRCDLHETAADPVRHAVIEQPNHPDEGQAVEQPGRPNKLSRRAGRSVTGHPGSAVMYAALMDPAQRAPAPARLRVLQAFINTNDIEGHLDAFASLPQLAEWLAQHDLAPADLTLTESDRGWVISVREALRDLIEARDEGGDTERAIAVLDAASRSAGLSLSFGSGGAALQPTRGGVRGAVGRILAEVPWAMVSDDWHRLKVCRNDACRWVFYDASRNRSSRWCTMALCGNRMKARAYRARARGASAA